MRSLIFSFIKKAVSLLANFYSFSLSKRISILHNRLYTIWIQISCNITGTNNYIQYPIYIEGDKFIKIGNNCSFGKRLRLEAISKYLNNIYTPEIFIGSNVDIGSDCHIGSINKIVIGDNVLIASKVFITDHSHGKNDLNDMTNSPRLRSLYSKGCVIIEKNVWIGESVSILPNVYIGENCIIGANSVVTKSFPANSIVAGNPAKLIRILNDRIN